MSNQCTSLGKIKSRLGINACRETLRKAIHKKMPLVFKRKAHAPFWTPAHLTKRVEWCTARMDASENWKRWIFSDEKKFNLDGPDGWNSYWHDMRKEELIHRKRQHGGGKVMVWGAIGYHGRTTLHVIVGNMNSQQYQVMLSNALLPVRDGLAQNPVIFQQDNAPIHASASTKTWLNQNINWHKHWPAKSPDLNPIENMWSIMSRKVYDGGKQYNSTQELTVAIHRAWNEIPQATVQKLIDSMYRRCGKVIETKGLKAQ
jgi:hypothetical protein